MAPPKKILNRPEDSVEEFVQGLLLQYPDRLSRVENHHVIILQKINSTAQVVRLFSGGGSGHEPSHAGWIGNGMLAGAICGGIFASPSVSSILAAIRCNSKENPILLIVKNYTGDRLNFGMAAERANQEGWDVRLLVVADDCAMPRTKGITGARGLAGTVLVHKVAGAAAQAGYTLDQVDAVAKTVAGRMGTLGIALESVTIPGAEAVNDRLDDKTIEIGLGIHGEAGLKQSPLISANEMAREMITKIRDYGRTVENNTIVPMFQPGDEVCLLVNNLGGTVPTQLPALAIDDFSSLARASIVSATTKLAEAEPLLTKCDVIVGDGDCGITMKRGATEVAERVKQTDTSKPHIPTEHPIPMFAALADAVSASMGGTSGVLLELMLRKMGSTLGKCGTIDKSELCKAFKAGVDAVSLYGGASVGSRTMLDALVPAAESLLLKDGDLKAAAQLARLGADGTANMKAASAGRSNYLSEETLDGTPDPGAMAVAIILENL